ncbi:MULTISPECIES: metal-dependent hydrolase [unclassified Pyramidobacter]|uniref:metal-dependent hydrolase n=1 Tax=unclassified Pyramidobacter TaxID=2632171 RepID=UPI000EA0A842|nr:metal-dependent hydrolase [Pyramidobacter sp. CG50-2]RKJ76089.1 metal-dependent hydrolase [Pyramidobacter sp. CG50-2]
MAVKFTYFGGMAILIEREDGYKILVDPFISANPLARIDVKELYDVDLLLVSHAAFDHVGDTYEILKNGHAQFFAGWELCQVAKNVHHIASERVYATIYGDEREFGQIKVHTVWAQHLSVCQNGEHPVTGFPLGFIIDIEPSVTYYHTGDTSLFSDMRLIGEMYRPGVMVVGISKIENQYPCEMHPREAAQAVQWVSPDVAIPSHYAPSSPAPEEFKEYMRLNNPHVKIMGECNRTFVYTPSNADYAR